MKREYRKFFHRYLVIPRQLVEGELHDLSDASLRVYLYILHRTIGFNKLSETITVPEFMDGLKTSSKVYDVGTGVKRSTAKAAIRDLEKKQWISVKREHNKHNIYTVSKFLRVSKLTPGTQPECQNSDTPECQFPNTPLIKENIKKGGADVVSMPKRRKA